MKVVAFYSIKGGVGKTAACVNIAYLAAAEKAPTLVCDLDPQGSASYYLRITPGARYNGGKLLKGGKAMVKNIKGSDFDFLDLLPANLSYRHLDVLLDGMKRPRKRLGELLAPLAAHYRYIFLDCPPNITLISENVFRASDVLAVPLIPTVLSLRSFEKLVEFFEQSGFNPAKIRPFFSMMENRKRMHRQMCCDPALQGRRLLNTAIPYLSQIEQMGLYRQPLTHRYPQSKGAAAFKALWEELKAVMGAGESAG
jgi:cellulose biosynthesis protein BcsQ